MGSVFSERFTSIKYKVVSIEMGSGFSKQYLQCSVIGEQWSVFSWRQKRCDFSPYGSGRYEKSFSGAIK